VRVWIIEGWFGDVEWIEEVHADEAAAEARVAELWKTRASEKGPAYAKGLHKFAAEPYDVIGGAA
jgi:hypothetical protein